MSFTGDDIEAALQSLQEKYRGPGGAAAVIHNGQVWTKTWGYADLERRIALTSKVQMPICSISKQYVCLVLVDLIKNPTTNMLSRGEPPERQLAKETARLLPDLANVQGGPVTMAHLYNMQSGIRDYWAMTTLWGARPDDSFSLSIDAPKMLERTKSCHFEPGTEFSYSNVNFHVLARAAENVSGQSLSQLLAERVFNKAGMTTAFLSANTLGPPLPVVGYDGDEKHGYVPATNRIEWSGDAGIVASLEDMIAYEKWLHQSWDDPSSLYRAITQRPTYGDGTPAYYGSGLMFDEVRGKALMGHAGALRGFRIMRSHLPTENLSVVIFFNHEADSPAAALHVIKALLKSEDKLASKGIEAVPEWFGSYLDDQTQLIIDIKNGTERGNLLISYDGEEAVLLTSPTHAESKGMHATIDGDTITIERPKENRTLRGRRIVDKEAFISAADYSGEYYCAEVMSTMKCSGDGTLMYGAFDGYLGAGPVNLMRYVGESIWMLATPRGLDAPAPGDWTVVFHRDGDGRVVGASVGCWLARRLNFVKVSK